MDDVTCCMLSSATWCMHDLPPHACVPQARSQLSHRLGYESHAHRVLADKMTGGPANATAFLAQLNHSIRVGEGGQRGGRAGLWR